MSLFLAFLRHGFRQTAAYKLDIVITIVQFIVRMGSVLLLWGYILRGSFDQVSLPQRLSYFLLAEAVSMFIAMTWFRFGRYIIKSNKAGILSSYLIRPVSPILYLYSEFSGSRLVFFSLSISSAILACYLWQPDSYINVILFFVGLILALAVSLGFNLIIGSCSFWTVEAGNIKNMVSHIVRVFGGTLIPILMFEEVLGKGVGALVRWSPFPVTAFTPVYLFQTWGQPDFDFGYLGAAILWAVLIPLIGLWIWRKGLKRYEAVGI